MTGPLSAELERAARRHADQQSARLAEAAEPPLFYANVTTVTAGAARDGNARVTVTWRGGQLTVNGYAAAYTPVVGHRVLCARVDNQVEILHRSVGAP